MQESASLSIPSRGMPATAGLSFTEGGHTVYIPPQADLEVRLGRFATAYPQDAGFKILKNARPPAEAAYLFTPYHSRIQSALIGTALDLIPVANFLADHQIGPPLYDVAMLRAGALTFTMFVVRHVRGCRPSVPEYRQFIARVRNLVDQKRVVLACPDWENDDDFRCPDCAGNLLRSLDDNGLYYVDFQNFFLCDDGERASPLLNQIRRSAGG